MKTCKCGHTVEQHFNGDAFDSNQVCTVDGCHCQNAPEIVQRDILSAAVSEAAYILSNLIEMDDTGLVFVTSADGKVLERAVAFLEAAKGE